MNILFGRLLGHVAEGFHKFDIMLISYVRHSPILRRLCNDGRCASLPCIMHKCGECVSWVCEAALAPT